MVNGTYKYNIYIYDYSESLHSSHKRLSHVSNASYFFNRTFCSSFLNCLWDIVDWLAELKPFQIGKKTPRGKLLVFLFTGGVILKL